MAFRIDDAVCLAQTDKAIKVDAPVLDEPVWVPQSQVEDDSEVYAKNTEGVLVVSDWWAEKQGWA